jgi:xanthine dehydrogenase accessory factor
MKRAVLERLRGALAAGRPAALATVLSSGAQALDDGAWTGDLHPTAALRSAMAEAIRRERSSVETVDGQETFLQVFLPPLRCVIVGAVHIAQQLVPMAGLAGYRVTVVDPRHAFGSAERFPGVTLTDAWPDEALRALNPDRRTAIVTLTHDPKLDDPALDVALAGEAFYIGALGSRRTHAARLERLAARGHGPAALARIHGPAGLAIGAVSPAEIAIAILAQMTQVLRQGSDAT